MLIHSYRPATLLKVTGDDAAAFLQGQFTNELRQPAGASVYGLWLTQKGKVLADSHVLRVSENEALVTSVFSLAAVITQRLEGYIVADDVTLADETAQVHGLAVMCPGCGGILKEVLGAVPAAGQFLQPAGLLFFAGRRQRGENYELIGPAKVIAETQRGLLAAGGREAGAQEMELARIMDGIPAIPPDLGPDDLPNEAGLEDSAISYTKGCYLGQEVMARLKNMGQIRRRLHLVQGMGELPAALAPLYQGTKKVGELRSRANRDTSFVALAMLSLVNLVPASGLSLAPDAAPTLSIIPHG